jgi:hypothetical protein
MSTHDPDFRQEPKYGPEPYETRSQHGCFFYGCIIASVLALLVVIAIGVVSYLGYRFLNRLVDEYTSPTASELPKVDMSVESRQALKDRIEAFRKAVDAGTATEPLVLTSTDLNALLEEEPKLKGKVYVSIEGDKLKGQISIPLEWFGLTMYKGRYLNGEADLKASLKDGVLIVTLDSIEVNGKKPPEQMLASLRQQNLAKDAYNDPKQAELLRKIDSLEIKDDKIIVKVRARGEQAKTPASSDKEADAGKAAAAPPADAAPHEKSAAPADSPVPVPK